MPRKEGRELNPKWELWRAQCVRARDMIDRIESAPNPHGPKWLEKMVAHYQGELARLAAVEPPKFLDEVATGKAALKRIQGTLTVPRRKGK